MDAVSSILPVIILLAVGAFCRKKNIITQEGIVGIQSLVMNIALPVGLFLTFFNASLTWSTIAFPTIIFAVNAVGVPLGRFICKLFHQENRFLPFAITTSEDGMIGYALLTLLMQKSQMTTFALMDLGQVLGFFVVTYQILQHELTGEKGSAKKIVKSILTTPLLVGMLAGIICSAFGLNELVNATVAGPILSSACNFISAPTNAAILIVIGYRINFNNSGAGKLLSAMLMRMIQQGIICLLVLGLFRIFGGIFTERLTSISVIAMMILPGSYLLPIYVEPEEQKEFYSSFISIYTLLTIAGFIIMVLLY